MATNLTRGPLLEMPPDFVTGGQPRRLAPHELSPA